MVGQRKRSYVEEKMIKKMDVLGDCDDLDVKAAVMKQVRAIHDQQKINPLFEMEAPIMQKQKTVPQRTFYYRKRLLSGVSAAVLLGGLVFGVLQLSGLRGLEQSTQSTIEISKPSDGVITLMNSGGKAVVQTAQSVTGSKDKPTPNATSAIEKYQSLLTIYKEQVLAHLNAGEMAAYYVNDTEFTKLAKGLGYGNQLQYAFNPPVYSKYQEFVEELKGSGDFWSELPSTLTNGYEFERGTFNASTPDLETERANKEFQQLQKDDVIGRKLFVAKINVEAIESAEITYHKGNEKIPLSLSRSPLMGNNAQQVFILEGQTAEKWSLTNTGKEAVFIAASTAQGAEGWNSMNRLYWYDEASRMIRSLNDELNNSLTREQWQVIANSFIR
ncbi:hypothetical protein D3C76_567250 [compost metagenome]